MFTRRHLLKMAGLLLAPTALLAARRGEGRVFDVKLGHRGTVYLGRQEATLCVRCRTGRHGWVDRYAADPNGHPFLGPDDDVAMRPRQFGRVRFEPDP